MSRSQTTFGILWEHASASPGPFEIDEVAPRVQEAIGGDEKSASQRVASLLDELARLPEGERFFRLEGNAVVPLPEFEEARSKGVTAQIAYPYED